MREGLLPAEDTVLEGSELAELLARRLSRMHAAIVVDSCVAAEGIYGDLWITGQWGSLAPQSGAKDPHWLPVDQNGPTSPAVWALAAAKRA